MTGLNDPNLKTIALRIEWAKQTHVAIPTWARAAPRRWAQWTRKDSNLRHPVCKTGALNQTKLRVQEEGGINESNRSRDPGIEFPIHSPRMDISSAFFRYPKYYNSFYIPRQVPSSLTNPLYSSSSNRVIEEARTLSLRDHNPALYRLSDDHHT